MNFLDCFAGIGGFRLGLEKAGHTCIGYVEKDRYARQSYEAIYDTGKEDLIGEDITKITDEEFRKLRGKVDVLVGGFPCQAFSIAGHKRGFSDIRGTLFFELVRATKQIKPQILLFENVKNLLSHNKGKTFETILYTLDELGYDVEWQLLNSKNYGVPQHRERVFIIGHLRGERGRKVFPIRSSYKQTPNRNGKSTNTITARYGEAQSNGSYVIENKQKKNVDNLTILVKEATVKGYSVAHLGDSINLEYPDSKTRRGRVGKKVAQTLTTSCNQGVIISVENTQVVMPENTKEKYRVRKLTPKECWRLQGFPDWAFDKARSSGVSDSQLYKQAGNAVTVNVAYEIGLRL